MSPAFLLPLSCGPYLPNLMGRGLLMQGKDINMFEMLELRVALVGVAAAVIIAVRNVLLDRLKSEKKDVMGQFRKYVRGTKKQKAENKIYGEQ